MLYTVLFVLNLCSIVSISVAVRDSRAPFDQRPTRVRAFSCLNTSEQGLVPSQCPKSTFDAGWGFRSMSRNPPSTEEICYVDVRLISS